MLDVFKKKRIFNQAKWDPARLGVSVLSLANWCFRVATVRACLRHRRTEPEAEAEAEAEPQWVEEVPVDSKALRRSPAAITAPTTRRWVKEAESEAEPDDRTACDDQSLKVRARIATVWCALWPSIPLALSTLKTTTLPELPIRKSRTSSSSSSTRLTGTPIAVCSYSNDIIRPTAPVLVLTSPCHHLSIYPSFRLSLYLLSWNLSGYSRSCIYSITFHFFFKSTLPLKKNLKNLKN